MFINATNFFACAKSASIWLYGKKWKEQYPKNVIIHNSINLDKFSFSSNIRAQLRKKYDVQDKICLFHAGRFSYEKNHKFLIDLISKMPNDKYCLILAGTGDLFDEIKLSDFHPNPTPLCYWCLFSKTYNNQPKEAKGLCPYYSLWTKQNKNFNVNHKWLGLKNHQKILEEFQNNEQ